jgi:hypothetical protein
MRHFKGFLIFGALCFLIVTCVAFSQSDQPVQKRLLSIDSLRAKTIPFPPLIEPANIAPATIEREEPFSDEGPNLGPGQSGGSGVEQWVTFRFSSTMWSWDVRKPGTYGGKIFEGSVQSNGDVLVDFSGFANLGLLPGAVHLSDNYYAIAPPSTRIQDLRWMTPGELNAFDLRVDPSNLGLTIWALWHRVEVMDYSPAEEFDFGASISIKLQNDFPFFEPAFEPAAMAE